jgi:hypothetical protein
MLCFPREIGQFISLLLKKFGQWKRQDMMVVEKKRSMSVLDAVMDLAVETEAVFDVLLQNEVVLDVEVQDEPVLDAVLGGVVQFSVLWHKLNLHQLLRWKLKEIWMYLCKLKLFHLLRCRLKHFWMLLCKLELL